MKKLAAVASLLALFAACGPVYAAQVTVVWDPNPAAEQVAGYTLHQGSASRTYDAAKKLDVTTGTQGTVTVPDTGKTYLAVTAWRLVGTQRLESAYSAEVVYDPAVYALPGAPGNAKATKVVVTRPDGTSITVTIP